MRPVLQRPTVRAGIGIVVVVAVIVGAVAFYLFGFTGLRGGAKHASGPSTAPTLAPTKDGTIYALDSSGSQASFTIHEVLFGRPNTVVGKSTSVAGQILINRQDPSKSQLGEIRVDLSTLLTDNDFRNNALQHRILETDTTSNQYATFVAKLYTGLPETITLGQPVSFHVTGDLTIHSVTRTVTFDAQVTLVNATMLTGQAQTTVRYADFGIAISNVPSVTGVGDTVQLALTFTAHAT